jgi:hypothetical protein
MVPRGKSSKQILTTSRLDGGGHWLSQGKPAKGKSRQSEFVLADQPDSCFPKYPPLSVACRVCLLHKVKIWTLLAELTFP